MVVIGLVGAVLSATAMSWHGILLSETARLAPFGSKCANFAGLIAACDSFRTSTAASFIQSAESVNRATSTLHPGCTARRRIGGKTFLELGRSAETQETSFMG
jgi:hypothetical protein